MKKIKVITIILTVSLGVAALMSGCSLAGLSIQKDFNRSTTDTIDAHLYKTTWAYIKSRAYGSSTDTVFRRMYDGIIYSGIDTNEYIKPNRTFILLNNNAITTSKTGLWAVYLNNKVAGKNWTSYSPADVKNFLSYLILLGQYSHYNLPLADVVAQTLAPAGAYTTNPVGFTAPGTFVSNPNSTMALRVSNANTVTSQLDYPIVLNELTNVNTSDLMPTNGVIFALNSNTFSLVPYYTLPQ